MTPKEKALELFNKFSLYLPFYYQWENRKQCALIAVDEIINNFPDEFWPNYTIDNTSFWQEVKQEIETL